MTEPSKSDPADPDEFSWLEGLDPDAPGIDPGEQVAQAARQAFVEQVAEQSRSHQDKARAADEAVRQEYLAYLDREKAKLARAHLDRDGEVPESLARDLRVSDAVRMAGSEAHVARETREILGAEGYWGQKASDALDRNYTAEAQIATLTEEIDGEPAGARRDLLEHYRSFIVAREEYEAHANTQFTGREPEGVREEYKAREEAWQRRMEEAAVSLMEAEERGEALDFLAPADRYAIEDSAEDRHRREAIAEEEKEATAWALKQRARLDDWSRDKALGLGANRKGRGPRHGDPLQA